MCWQDRIREDLERFLQEESEKEKEVSLWLYCLFLSPSSIHFGFLHLMCMYYVRTFCLICVLSFFRQRSITAPPPPPPPTSILHTHTHTYIQSHTHMHVILWKNIKCLSFTSFTLKQSWFPHLFCLTFFYSFFRTYIPSSSHILISNSWRTQGHIISGSLVVPSVTFQESNSQLHVLLLYY